METTFTFNTAANFENRMLWKINFQCNLLCSYCCDLDNLNKTETEIFQADEIAKAFDNTQKKWLIVISGGEPLLYPGIIEIISKLAQKHYIVLQSNLAGNLTHNLAEISPEKLLAIVAAYHPTEREKTEKGINDFIYKCTYLQDRGHNVIVDFLALPKVLKKIKSECKNLQKKGIENISVSSIRAIIDGSAYPLSYSAKEIEKIEKYTQNHAEIIAAKGQNIFLGYACAAGTNYFMMNPNGDVFRCASIQKGYGNIFKGSFKPDNELKPCSAGKCVDGFLGEASVTDQKTNTLKLTKELLKRFISR